MLPALQPRTTTAAIIHRSLLSGTEQLACQIDKGTTVNLNPFVQRAGNTALLLSYISSIFLHGSMSPELTQAVTDSVNAAFTIQAKAQAALYVVLTSSEYQIVH